MSSGITQESIGVWDGKTEEINTGSSGRTIQRKIANPTASSLCDIWTNMKDDNVMSQANQNFTIADSKKSLTVADITTDLRVLATFDTDLTDSSGNGFDGQDNGTASTFIADGPVGAGGVNSAKTGKIEFPASGTFRNIIPADPMTFFCWCRVKPELVPSSDINIETSVFQYINTSALQDATKGWSLDIQSKGTTPDVVTTKLRLLTESDDFKNQVWEVPGIYGEGWVSFCLILNNGDIEIWVNGLRVVKDTYNVGVEWLSGARPLELGPDLLADFDDMRIFNRVLDPLDIYTLHNLKDNVHQIPADTGSGEVAFDFNTNKIQKGIVEEEGSGVRLEIFGEYVIIKGLIENAFEIVDDGCSYLKHFSGAQLPLWSQGSFVTGMYIKATAGDDKTIWAESDDTATGASQARVVLRTGSGVDNDKLNLLIVNDAGTEVVNATSAGIIAGTSDWVHIGIIKSTLSVDVYIDGVLDATVFDFTGTLTNINASALGALIASDGAQLINGFSVEDWKSFPGISSTQHVLDHSRLRHLNACGDPNVDSVSNDGFNLLIPAALRPGLSDITFSIKDLAEADAVVININNVGTFGQSALVITGGGIVDDPFVYNFNMFDNESSNDRILNLLEKDLYIDVVGNDPINDVYTEVTNQTINHPFSCYFDPIDFIINYVAEHPQVINLDDEIDKSIPPRIAKKGLSSLVTAEMLENDEGGDKNLAAIHRAKYTQTVSKSLGHRMSKAVPYDVQPM